MRHFKSEFLQGFSAMNFMFAGAYVAMAVMKEDWLALVPAVTFFTVGFVVSGYALAQRDAELAEKQERVGD